MQHATHCQRRRQSPRHIKNEKCIQHIKMKSATEFFKLRSSDNCFGFVYLERQLCDSFRTWKIARFTAHSPRLPTTDHRTQLVRHNFMPARNLPIQAPTVVIFSDHEVMLCSFISQCFIMDTYEKCFHLGPCYTENLHYFCHSNSVKQQFMPTCLTSTIDTKSVFNFLLAEI